MIVNKAQANLNIDLVYNQSPALTKIMGKFWEKDREYFSPNFPMIFVSVLDTNSQQRVTVPHHPPKACGKDISLSSRWTLIRTELISQISQICANRRGSYPYKSYFVLLRY